MTRKKFESHKEIAAQITKLVRKVSGWQWEIGDLIIEAIELPAADGQVMTQTRFRVEYISDVHKSYVSRWVNTAKAFSQADREYASSVGATWQDCEETRTSYENCKKRKTLFDGETIRDHLDGFLSKKDETFNPRRETKERAEARRVEAIASRQEVVKQIQAEAPEYLKKVVNGDAIRAMADEPNKSFNLVWLDPPYAQYYKYTDGRCPMPSKGSPILTDCDANNRKDAEVVTLDAMRQGERLLAEKGSLILWQAGSEPDRVAVLQLARDLGLEVILPLYWDKQQPQPGNFVCPFGYQTERVLVMARDWDSFYSNGDMPGRTDILNYKLAERLFGEQRIEHPSEARSSLRAATKKDGIASFGNVHLFQKPRWICRYFLERLTLPGDRVLDPFGCSGMMCAEAIAHDRDWLYVESNETNYNLGLTNIRDELIKKGLIDQN